MVVCICEYYFHYIIRIVFVYGDFYHMINMHYVMHFDVSNSSPLGGEYKKVLLELFPIEERRKLLTTLNMCGLPDTS